MRRTRHGRRIAALLAAGAALVATAASATAPRYVVQEVNREWTVEDRATGLAWQLRASGAPANWGAALRHCEELTWAGATDWRLPDVIELSTIVDDRRTAAPAINLEYFAGFDAGSGYWSSTTARRSPGSAYVLYFNEQNATVGRGGTGIVNKTASIAFVADREVGALVIWPFGRCAPVPAFGGRGRAVGLEFSRVTLWILPATHRSARRSGSRASLAMEPRRRGPGGPLDLPAIRSTIVLTRSE